ncbi:nucleotide sugar dehydrogenase [Histidinibacterium aquaticum]|uniref:Nucleotide sugar dehydrogenase n=1 Tax=Histidinibacterium aquaticum TaxID=2613962 RepID=A0A5J5GA95_9RHOB|nr:nucleotide sugar dehydrogenase [Histidinibacterium aquaticum]KAA9005046.1 nucleotide sugar dehydrogenase [Histidinibacterium aquaticum]
MTAALPDEDSIKVAVVGLGYVGLPLAVAFAEHFPTIGYDLSVLRVREITAGRDSTGQVEPDELRAAGLRVTNAAADLRQANTYIVSVPTPIDRYRQPDLGPLLAATETLGGLLSPGDLVIYESTVYPGATEEDCVPLLESLSGLVLNTDFFVGYSPERINPGDIEHPLKSIVKVTSGSCSKAAARVDALYSRVIDAGTFPAASIRVAEAAKIIENTQRDVNIALINELSIVFSHMGLDTHEILDAAATKWNFQRLSPGLVGGHCIGVDPYYLLHKSASKGYIPDIVRTSREINDGMAKNAVSRLIAAMINKGQVVRGARVLVLGVTFKENCRDIRNTKVTEMVAAMKGFGLEVEIHDPLADPAEVARDLGIKMLEEFPQEAGGYGAVVLAVPHREIVEGGAPQLVDLLSDGGVFFDMKAVFGRDESDIRL